MVLFPVKYPAEVHFTAISALQNGKFSSEIGVPPLSFVPDVREFIITIIIKLFTVGIYNSYIQQI